MKKKLSHRFFRGLLIGLFSSLSFAPLALGAAADGGGSAPASKPVPSSASKAPKASAPKTQFNSQVYEKSSDEEQSFTAVVKVIREIQGETEVFFEGKSGFYNVGSANQNLLAVSQKKRIPVAVSVNTQSRQILKVEISTEGGSSGF